MADPPPLSERIATLALATFDQLPQRCKPRTLIDGRGRREWTPMSAIVLAYHTCCDRGDQGDTKHDNHGNIDSWCQSGQNVRLKCVSLGTGTKCLPASQVRRCNGLVLHDCHAEILALRGFNRWLLNEMKYLLDNTTYISNFIELDCSTNDRGKADSECGSSEKMSDCPRFSSQATPLAQGDDTLPFRLRSSFEIYMFSTTAPCGDASMSLLIASSTDQTPWSFDPHLVSSTSTSVQPLGRGHFSMFGLMRRKPARGDAEATLSKSCTDKIALKQFTSAISFPVDVLLSQQNFVGSHKRSGFLKGIIVYEDQFDNIGYGRAFSRDGRLHKIIVNKELRGTFFDTHVLRKDFPGFAFERKADDSGGKYKTSNISAVFVGGTNDRPPVQEVLVNGVRQGYKQFEERHGKGSVLCRRNMMALAIEIQALLQARGIHTVNVADTRYNELKRADSRAWRRSMKKLVTESLAGWQSNSVDDDFDVVTT